jgi:hypothetical protein
VRVNDTWKWLWMTKHRAGVKTREATEVASLLLSCLMYVPSQMAKLMNTSNLRFSLLRTLCSPKQLTGLSSQFSLIEPDSQLKHSFLFFCYSSSFIDIGLLDPWYALLIIHLISLLMIVLFLRCYYPMEFDLCLRNFVSQASQLIPLFHLS